MESVNRLLSNRGLESHGDPGRGELARRFHIEVDPMRRIVLPSITVAVTLAAVCPWVTCEALVSHPSASDETSRLDLDQRPT